MELYEKTTVTCAEMKELEKAAAAAGLSFYDMMENAGTKAAEFVISRCPEAVKKPRVAIFCGKGNNGGDGFVAARKLFEAGWTVTLVLVEGDPETEDAIKNYRLIKDKVEVLDMHEAPATGGYDIVIDAVYGTGFHGELKEASKAAVELINKMGYQKSVVFSLDIPSGISGDMTGRDEPEKCVMADYTIAFHAKKPVHDNGRMTDLLGIVEIADIGIGEAVKKGDR